MIKFPSIDQFRSVIKRVKDRAKQEDGKFSELPILKFFGTVKMHGTNASIVQYRKDMYPVFQSREQEITPLKDNAGFATAMSTDILYQDTFLIFDTIRNILKIDAGTPVTIYGEWCGGNIQSGIALNSLPKMFVVFSIRVGADEDTKWFRADSNEFREVEEFIPFYTINTFMTYEVEVDFEFPEVAQNLFVKFTKAVEEECPVGMFFNVKGIGEGIVWHCSTPGYESSDFVFKTKGDKHSASKVKVIAAVDVERVEGIKALVETIVTENRMLQMSEDIEFDIINTGTFVKKVIADSVKEELDTIVQNGFEVKEFAKYASTKASAWFRSKGV